MTLPEALQPFARHRQFITYTTRPKGDGKTDKIPTDWRTGNPANAHDATIWTDYTTAAEHGPVGFVFTDGDPFWFLDIDNCLTPTGWSPLALELCAALPGAAVEVSISGKGLHIYGAGILPRHKTKNIALGLELYHTARFVALGTGAVGNAMTDHSTAMTGIIARYFAGNGTTSLAVDDAPPSDWTTAPVAEWRGPTDDDELIRRACASKSTAAAFGGRASFAQLWDADPVALANSYPDSARGYDASSADAALAQHLAFWTGKNCERIAALMRKSKLMRPKWDEHSSYIERTVLQAVGQQADVCKDKAAEPVAQIAKVQAVTGETFLQPEDIILMFDGCVYVLESHSIMMKGGALLNEARFNALLGGYSYVIDRAASKMAKHPWDAFINTRDLRFPKVARTEFDPSKPPGAIWAIEGSDVVNSYVPIKTASRKGNPKPFIDHLVKILPVQRDRDIVLAYMAAVVQHPGIKFQWAPLIQGAPGNGKTLLSRCVTEAVGRMHCHTPKSKEITSRFNDWIDGKVFIAVEDVFVSELQADLLEVLKPMITSDWQEIEGKGTSKVSRKVCANFMLNSNHKDAIQKTKDDRRFAIFYTAQQSWDDIVKAGMSGNYFPELYNWLRRDGYAIVTDYLKNYAIPAELNPAGDCHRAPLTSSTEEAVTASIGRLEQEIIHAVEQEQIGFRNGWISSHFLDQLIKGMKLESRYPRNKRTALMEELSYFPHPGIPGGQVNNTVSPDGVKPRLYLMPQHPAWELKGAEVSRQYSADQNNIGGLRSVA